MSDIITKADREADFFGTVCPLNYVKIKLLPEGMTKGQILSVILDYDGANNVPESAKQDGDKWTVIIQK